MPTTAESRTEIFTKLFGAFLFSTARNLAANEYRHRRIVERG